MIVFARYLSLVFLVLLVLAVWRAALLCWAERRRTERPTPQPGAGASPADPVKTTLSSLSASVTRWLNGLRAVFIVSGIAVLIAHGYWAFFVSGPLGESESYMRSKRLYDQRNRRLEEIGLRGWIFDRRKKELDESSSGRRQGSAAERIRIEEESLLAGYRLEGDSLTRYYPLGPDAASIIGYHTLVRGSSGAELAYNNLLRPRRGRLADLWKTRLVGEDVILTLDARLQRAAAQALRRTGRPGAVVVLSVEDGDILAMASMPTFDPRTVEDDAAWEQLVSDPAQRLINRAVRQYYLPGSTFKTLVAVAALENGWKDLTFTCSREGYRPGGSSRPIYDDGGPGEGHGRIGLADALRVSCNQYFAQLGVMLGADRLAETARRFGFHIDPAPESARDPKFADDLWTNQDRSFERIFSPNVSRLVLSPTMGAYDVALESYGQGFVQVTPLQMALLAQAVAHPRGEMMAPRLDFLQPPRVLARPLSAATAARMRALLTAVTSQPGGTATSAFASLRRQGVLTGGKTGTAQIETPGGRRVDSWFIGFAPSERPQIAYAIVVEGGGYGGAVAAPIAAEIVKEALDAGIVRAMGIPVKALVRPSRRSGPDSSPRTAGRKVAQPFQSAK